MRVLITGGNGYVGRRLCRQLLSEGHQVGVIDNLRFGSNRFTPEEQQSIHWENIDIREAGPVRAAIDRFSPDAIVHLAAIHFIPECEGNPELAVSTNVLGTSNIASLCPKGCRFVFASTGAVYRPENTPHHELNSPLDPSDVYGWTKLHGENYVRYFAARQRYPACIVRLFNVIGPGETNPHVLPEIVAQLKAGRRTLKLGNLAAKRDYIHVQDVARGFASVACRGTIEGGETCVVNLGTQASYSVEELLDALRSMSQSNFVVESDPSRFRATDRPYLAADIQRIRQLFQWSPEYSIEAALRDLWNSPDIPESWIDRYR